MMMARTRLPKPLLVPGAWYRITRGGIGYPQLTGKRAQAKDTHLLVIDGDISPSGFVVPSADVNYHRIYTRRVCNCPAYNWPHALGRGRCDRED